MTKKLTNNVGAPVADNQNVMTAGPRGPQLLQDVWFLEKLAHFDREVIPERRMHAKGSGAYGTFTVTHDIDKYTKAKVFSQVGKETDVFVRFSTVAGERGAADAGRDIRGFAIKYYTEEGNWDLVGNNTPVFFLRGPLKFTDLNHAVKRDPKTNLRSARNNWNFWTSLPEALHQVTITMSDRGIPYSYRHMNGYGEWQEQPDFREPALALDGAADHWSHREDDDNYYSQPRALFKAMGPEQQKVLFENTARAMGDAPKEIKIRHIGSCMKADPAYGKGVASALGIPMSEVLKD